MRTVSITPSYMQADHLLSLIPINLLSTMYKKFLLFLTNWFSQYSLRIMLQFVVI